MTGIAQAVGLAIAGKHLGSVFNKDDISLFDSNVYALCGDGMLLHSFDNLKLAKKKYLHLGRTVHTTIQKQKQMYICAL